jgi:oligopeptide transport system permease protein
MSEVRLKSQTFGAGGAPLTTRRASMWTDAARRLVRNRASVIGSLIIIILFLAALFADQIAPRSFDKQVLQDQNKVPNWMISLFPTTKPYVGRDMFSRLIYGARVSLTVAFIGPIISLLIGVLYGSIAGYFGGRVDNLMMRVVDILYAFPTLLFIILLMAFFRSTLSDVKPGTFAYAISQLDAKLGGLLFIFVGIGLTAWQNMARLTRGQVLSMRQKEFVEAAQTIGASNLRIMFRHILPNVVGPLIVAETLAIPGYISTETFLSFIGLGVNPPTPSWGSMISEGQQVIRTYPNQAIFPALALAITMFAFNFLGDGLRDALDPRLRGTQ